MTLMLCRAHVTRRFLKTDRWWAVLDAYVDSTAASTGRSSVWRSQFARLAADS